MAIRKPLNPITQIMQQKPEGSQTCVISSIATAAKMSQTSAPLFCSEKYQSNVNVHWSVTIRQICEY